MNWTPQTDDPCLAAMLAADQPVKAATLADALAGTRQVRLGPCPNPEQEAALKALCAGAVAEGRPVDVLTMWGAVKGYDQLPVRSVCLLDLMALRQLAALDAAVRRLHPPGVRVLIVAEDVTEGVLVAPPGRQYGDDLQALARAVGLDGVRVARESDLCQPAAFRTLALNYAEAFENGCEADIGWRGPVDWPYLLARAAGEHPGRDEAFLRRKVALYLGCCLARASTRMLPAGRVRLSFHPYPPSTPDALRLGRIEYKVKPGKGSNRATPPWCGFGLLFRDDWRPVTVREARAADYRPDEVTVSGRRVAVLRPPAA